MKKVEIELFRFHELEQHVQEKLIQQEADVDTSHVYEDARETVDKFLELFPDLATGNRSWLEPVTHYMHPNIMQMEGLRLQKWLVNNLWNDIYRPKYTYKPGNRRNRRSNCQVESVCPLTGVCYDHYILMPIMDVIKWKSDHTHTTMDMLISDCFERLRMTINNEVEYLTSAESIKDMLRCNGLWYTKYGQVIHL